MNAHFTNRPSPHGVLLHTKPGSRFEEAGSSAGNCFCTDAREFVGHFSIGWSEERLILICESERCVITLGLAVKVRYTVRQPEIQPQTLIWDVANKRQDMRAWEPAQRDLVSRQ
jgi:hypothetical protein